MNHLLKFALDYDALTTDILGRIIILDVIRFDADNLVGIGSADHEI